MAAFDSYTSLKASLAGWIHRSDVNGDAVGVGVDNVVEAWISLFEAWANRKLREEQMEVRAPVTVAAEYVAQPTGLLEIKSFVIADGAGSLTQLEPAPQWVIDGAKAITGETGRPRFFAMTGQMLRVYPAPDQSYTGTLTHYASLTPLSATTASNWLLVLAPDAYLYGALTNGAPYLRDMQSLPVWKGLRDEAMASVMESNRQPSARLRNEYADALGGRFNILTDQ